jgi:hypothetical protein
MRRLVLAVLTVTVVAALCPVAAQAQAFGVGVRGGLNYSTMSLELAPDEDIDYKTGLHAGVVLAYDIHRVFGLEVDGLYTQKGFKVQETVGTSVLEGTLTPAYIEIPLLAKLRYPLGGVAPRLLAGGSVAFEVSCKANAKVDGVTVVDGVDCDDPQIQAEERKKTEWSLLFGGGVEIAAGPAVVFLDVLYDLGVTNLDPTSTQTVKNRAWMFSAGLTYTLALF